MVADPALLDNTQIKLAIMGKMAAGKTFASTHLVNNWGGQAWTTAERIKQIAHALIDQTGDLGQLLQVVLLDDQTVELGTLELLRFAETYQPEPGNKPRHLYQEVGQILRELQPSTRCCWEEDLERRMSQAPAQFTIIDIRARESFNYFVNQRDFYSLLISSPEEVRRRRMQQRDLHDVSDPNLLNHVSETDVDSLQFDFEISNSDDDPSKFYEELDQMVCQLAEKETERKVNSLNV